MVEVNNVAMLGSAMEVLRANKFPYQIMLRAYVGPVLCAAFKLDEASSLEDATNKMYTYFDYLPCLMDDCGSVGCVPPAMVRAYSLAYDVFGECRFSVTVVKLGEE